MGLNNVIKVILGFHICLERIHFKQLSTHHFWSYEPVIGKFIFDDDAPLYTWVTWLGDQLKANAPLEPQEGMLYDSKSYRYKD